MHLKATSLQFVFFNRQMFSILIANMPLFNFRIFELLLSPSFSWAVLGTTLQLFLRQARKERRIKAKKDEAACLTSEWRCHNQHPELSGSIAALGIITYQHKPTSRGQLLHRKQKQAVNMERGKKKPLRQDYKCFPRTQIIYHITTLGVFPPPFNSPFFREVKLK